jgi:glycosyltransferase involved in cell wall biosynthesis
MLQVCICTHNPRPDVFQKVLAALGRQTQRAAVEIVIIDNASEPPIAAEPCRASLGPNIRLRLEREEELGIAKARARAVEVTSTDWILFVDDDTELTPDYIEQGLRIIAGNPGIGCFGGKLLLPAYLSPGAWTKPLLPFLAIKDIGDQPLTSMADEWRCCEPPTAGAFVRRQVLERYRSVIRANQMAQALGRKGQKGLRSGEDALMMRGAHAVGLSVSYQPALSLVHHLHPRRFRFSYLLRLMWGHGRTLFVLDRIAAAGGRSASAASPRTTLAALRLLFRSTTSEVRQSLRYACCMAAFRIGYRWELIVPDLSFGDLGAVAESVDQESEG